MNWVGYAKVPVKRLKLPGDIPARMKMPHVIELSDSIASSGDELVNAPAVDRDTMELLAGSDRMAAELLRKSKAVWCHMATDVSESDRANVEFIENFHRRVDDRDKLIARRVERIAGKLNPDKVSAINVGKTGAKKTAKGLAREQVARELDTTPEAVRAAEKRAAEPDEPSPEVEKQELPPPVETWGVPVEHLAQEFASVRIAQEAMRVADRHLQSAQRALSALKDGGGIAAHIHARLYSTVHSAAAHVRSDIPEALCPYCKGLAHRRDKCNGCQGIGYVGSEGLLGVAEELKLGGPLACVPDGKGGFVKVVQPKAAPKGKALQIQDADGNPIAVPAEDEGIPF